MLLKELVLTSQESYADFEVNGKPLNRETYLELACKEVEHYYLDVKDNQAYMVVTLMD
jgi:hypothetical protein